MKKGIGSCGLVKRAAALMLAIAMVAVSYAVQAVP